MANKSTKATESKKAPDKRATGDLKTRAFGEVAEGFGKEIAPLGPRAGALTAKVGGMLLGMLEGAVFGLEQVGSWLQEAIASRLHSIPEDKVVQPDPRIAVPAVQALVYSMGEKQIREMFADLLAANMNSDTRDRAHPAFVEIIKEMTAPEAQILNVLKKGNQIRWEVTIKREVGKRTIGSGFSFPVSNLTAKQIDEGLSNLARLGIVAIEHTRWPVLSNQVEIDEFIKKWIAENQFDSEENLRLMKAKKGAKPAIEKIGIFVTPLGRSFIEVCMPDGDPRPPTRGAGPSSTSSAVS